MIISCSVAASMKPPVRICGALWSCVCPSRSPLNTSGYNLRACREFGRCRIPNSELTLTSNLRSWHLPSSAAAGGRKSWRERVFYEKTWKFRDLPKGKTEILPAGNYEYPFEVVLEGSMPESVEGLAETWVMYRFKAEIGRKYVKDIVARKPLRIIRTLDPSALELSHAMVGGHIG